MKTCRRAACVLLAALSLLASPVHSTSFSIDQSDLYYIVTENGWGLQLVQRGSTIFATLFVYGPAGAPTWYVATMGPSAPTAGNATWSGDLYTASGTFFGTTPYNPANFVPTKVGTMTWVATGQDTGTLTYVVSGLIVVKNVVRETLVFDDFSGSFLGAIQLTATGCTDPTKNVPPTAVPFTTITVTQSGSTINITFTIVSINLRFSGTLIQNGQFGTATGSYSADGGEMGNGTISALNVQRNSLAGSFALQSTNLGCQDSGFFSGIRTTPAP